MRRAVSLRRILSSQWPARRFKDLSAISPPFDQLLGKAKGFSLRRCTVKTAIRPCPLRREGADLLIHIVEDHLRYVEQRSEEHTSELQYLMRLSYAVFCLKKTQNT